MNPEEMKRRTRAFAVAVFGFIEKLPKTVAGQTIARQVARSASSVAANYRAAQRGQTSKEFIAKMHDAREEADESQFWLGFAVDCRCAPIDDGQLLNQEASELTAILTQAIKTASRA